MSKFKVGDVVQRKPHHTDITKYLGCGNNGTYTVTAVNSHGSWIQLDGWDDAGKDRYPWYHINFILVESDELPPAPESVQYTTLQYDWQDKYNDQHLTAAPDSFADGICIHIQGSTTSQRNKDMALSVVLSSDEILQLCHDLRRMAMSLKKREHETS